MQRGAVIGIVIAIIAVVIIVLLAVVLPNNQKSSSNGAAEDKSSSINLPSPSPSPTPSPNPAEEETSAPQTFTVEITSSGFSPKSLEIKQGDSVVFLNKDTNAHWPASAVHPTHTVYPGTSRSNCGRVPEGSMFDACKGLAREESFRFTFNEVGSWNYHDHLNPGLFGTIKVI